jgi:predicted SnoaL-like aldol condensation-catalyzing enzyme
MNPAPGGDVEHDDESQVIARRWIEALNSGDLAAMDQLLSEDVIDHSGFSRIHGRGRDGVKRLVTELRRLIPDWSSIVDEIVVTGDRISIRHTGTGTPPAAFRGRSKAPAAAPARKVRLQLVSTIRVDEGRVVEHWARSE